MDLSFTPAERLFREEVRGWLADNAPSEPPPMHGPALREYELAWQRRQFDGGWAGISWPKEFGGRGLSTLQQLIWFEEYAASGAPSAACLVVALNHAGPTVILQGTEAQKSSYLPKILEGEVVWCQGFSEPNAGSDLASIRTKAVIDGDHLVVTGQKIWTSYGDIADYQELLVRTDTSVPKHKGISWVVCDMHLPGIDVRPIRTMAGHEHFCEVFYDEVRIPLTNVVGRVNDGWNVAMATLGFERGTGYVAHLIKLAHTVEKLIALAHERVGPDGRRPAIKDEEIAGRLADLRAEVAAMRAMSYAFISRDQQGPPGPQGSITALCFGEMAQRVHRLALDILGPAALAHSDISGNWTRSYLDSFRQTIAGGTSEIRRNIIGERVLGLPRGQ